jgi:hypothetical protein
LFPSDARVLFEEFIQGISALKIVEKRLERDARTTENGLAAKDLRVLHNYAL